MGQCHHSAARDVDAGTGLLKPTGGNQALASMKEKRAMQPRHQPIARDAMAYVLAGGRGSRLAERSEEHTSELQSLMRISYAVFCLKKKQQKNKTTKTHDN